MVWCRSEDLERKNVTRYGKNEAEFDCVDKKGTLTVFMKCEGNPS